MDFRTVVIPDSCQGLIDHFSPVLMLGSCFTDNIGAKLENAMFDVCVNPMGTLYNPASILSALDDIEQCREFTGSDLICHEGRYHSFSHHSSFSGVDKDRVLSSINAKMKESHRFYEQSQVVAVTLGTAYIYEKDGRVVSNCHKLPASEFVRRRLDVDEIVETWSKRIAGSGKHWIFTVSPIRHMADGCHDNQLSKSVLLLAIDELCRRCENTHYFPSYEIMMDDLRDYRFYAADMAHPSAVAVDYIYSRFQEAYFQAGTIALARRCEKLSSRLNHRFMTDDMSAIERFSAATQQMIAGLLSEYPLLSKAINKKTQTK